MKVLLVDDEKKALEILSMLIGHYAPAVQEVRSACGPFEATEMLKEYSPDLVFLDIKMPGSDGFQWLEGLKQRDFDVIFTTAYDQYAIQAIRYSAFDYLLKPVDPEDLVKALQRYRAWNMKAPFEHLFYNRRQRDLGAFKLTIVTTEGTFFLMPDEIIRCEADGNYTHFYLQGDKHILASRSLGYFADLLPQSEFIRCHKSHLINRRYVKAIVDKQLVLQNGDAIDISRRRISVVKDALI